MIENKIGKRGTSYGRVSFFCAVYFVSLRHNLKQMLMKKSFLFLAEGFEEVEALSVVDVLRRGNVDVETVSISGEREVAGAHGIPVKADRLLSEVKGTEAVEFLICPGGMPGSKHLAECQELVDWLQRHFDKGGNVAAICAAPALVLSRLKMAGGRKMTCYPGFEGYLPDADTRPEGVVEDGNLITGKGPAFAMRFGLAILKRCVSEKAAEEVAAGMLLE